MRLVASRATIEHVRWWSLPSQSEHGQALDDQEGTDHDRDREDDHRRCELGDGVNGHTVPRWLGGDHRRQQPDHDEDHPHDDLRQGMWHPHEVSHCTPVRGVGSRVERSEPCGDRARARTTGQLGPGSAVVPEPSKASQRRIVHRDAFAGRVGPRNSGTWGGTESSSITLDGMREGNDGSPSALSLLGTLVALVLLLGGIAAAVSVTVGTAIQRSLAPVRVADGSTCKPVSGDCTRLSRSAIEERTGTVLPREAHVVASGTRHSLKSFDAWAVVCVPDAPRLFEEARRGGFVDADPTYSPSRNDWSGKGPVSLELRRNTQSDGDQWLDLGKPCHQGSYVYLGYFLDK
jgi:hypothetical protein